MDVQMVEAGSWASACAVATQLPNPAPSPQNRLHRSGVMAKRVPLLATVSRATGVKTPWLAGVLGALEQRADSAVGHRGSGVWSRSVVSQTI